MIAKLLGELDIQLILWPCDNLINHLLTTKWREVWWSNSASPTVHDTTMFARQCDAMRNVIITKVVFLPQMLNLNLTMNKSPD